MIEFVDFYLGVKYLPRTLPWGTVLYTERGQGIKMRLNPRSANDCLFL